MLLKYGEQFGENDVDFTNGLNDMPESIVQNAELIDRKLFDVKVCEMIMQELIQFNDCKRAVA
jgi:hypothetical protein